MHDQKAQKQTTIIEHKQFQYVGQYNDTIQEMIQNNTNITSKHRNSVHLTCRNPYPRRGVNIVRST